jgi:hypothetical protein
MAAKRDFTDRFLKAIKPAEIGKRIILHDAQIPGFGIRVTERSAKENKGSFVLVTRFPGSTNPVPRRIGDYSAMSLAKASGLWSLAWRGSVHTAVSPFIRRGSRSTYCSISSALDQRPR